MAEKRFKTAILGLDECGLLLAECVSQLHRFELTAIADKDLGLCERTAEKLGCEYCDDYRLLITQHDLDCLVICEGLHSCEEYIRMAMRKKTHIFKQSPMARSFEEACELVKLSEKENVGYFTGVGLRYSRGFMVLRDFINSGQLDHINQINVQCFTSGKNYPSWQSDWKLSGGGVLLYDCYEIIDFLNESFSLPEHIYCLYTNKANDRKQRQYLTDECVILSLRYADGLIGSITTSNICGPAGIQIQVCGSNKTFTATKNSLIVCDNYGSVLERYTYRDTDLDIVKQALSEFWGFLVSSDKKRGILRIRENLENMAFIEASYLSGRTGTSEDASRILEMGGYENDADSQ